MVCKKCEKVSFQISVVADLQKTSQVATTDPFKPSAASGRKIGENKLLSARARAAPYAKPGGSRNVNPYSNKCIDCKVSVAYGCLVGNGRWDKGRSM